MTLQQTDMSKVEKWGEVLPKAWYAVRISKVEEGMSKQNQPKVSLQLKVTSEPLVGRILFDEVSLQPHALAKLKAYYEAVGYKPGPEGHDPETLLDRELFVLADQEVYEGITRNKIPPYGIRSLQDGPGKA
jgi:hypothetical protein